MTDPADSKALKDPNAVGLAKLNLEVEKITLEIKSLKRWPILHPSAFIPILVALVSLAGGLANIYFTARDRDRAFNARK